MVFWHRNGLLAASVMAACRLPTIERCVVCKVWGSVHAPLQANKNVWWV